MLTECMTAAGVPTTFNPIVDRIDVEGSGEDMDAVRTVHDECARQLDPQRLLPPPPLTEDEWQQRYHYLLAQIDCLSARGHQVPVAPDFASWRESNGAWDPYDALEQLGLPASNLEEWTCRNVKERPSVLDW